jgi:long-chain fatty acid transport protein
MYNVNPAVAYALNDRFSVAGGLDFFNVYDVSLKQKVPNIDSPLIPGTPTGDGNAELSGDGTGWGYNLGLLWKANEKHSFGLAYRSQVNVVIDGDAKLNNLQDATAFQFGGSEFDSKAHTEFKFPQSVTLGWGFKPTDRLTFFTDYEWVDWHSTKETKFNYDNGNAALNSRFDRDWRDTSNVGVGVEYWVVPSVALLGGALVYESVIPSNRMESAIPDTGRWALTAGPGFKFGDFGLDLNYQAVFMDSQNVDSNMGNGTLLDGKYKGYISVISAGVSYKWGAKKS